MTSSDAEQADAVQARFAERAERIAEREESLREQLREELREFLEPSGDERVLDAGAGAGALALALAPLVREVTAVEIVAPAVAEGREQAEAFPNVTFVEADIAHLPFEDGSLDVAATLRALHHVARPELVVAELARVTRFGGKVLIVDQIAPTDPLLAFEIDRFERARDPSHTRLLPDVDIRSLLDANGLVLRRSEFRAEDRDVESYLDLAACTGDARQRALAVAPSGYRATIGWYLASRQSFGS